MMRQQMTPENERVMRTLNSTDEIRKAFQGHPNLEKSLEESLKSYKELMDRTLSRPSLKDKTFQIFPAVSEEDISNLEEYLKNVFVAGIEELEKNGRYKEIWLLRDVRRIQ